MTLLSKLNNFRQKVGAVKKTASNPFYNSKYATLEDVMAVIDPILDELKINYIQIVEGDTLKTIVYDVEKDDDKITSSIPLVYSNDMQKLGSAITYARRYSLVVVFSLEQEDDDGNATVNKNKITNKVLETFDGSFIKPTQEEVNQYIMDNGFMNVNGVYIYGYFEKNNWKDKMGKPTDWKSAIKWFNDNPRK